MSCNDLFIINKDNNQYEFNINILNYEEKDDIRDLIFECNEVLYYFNKILYIIKKIPKTNDIFYGYVILFQSKEYINNKIVIKFEIPNEVSENYYSLKMFNKNNNNIIKHRTIYLFDSEKYSLKHNIYAMEYMNGDFTKLIEQMNYYNITNIDFIKYIDIIREQIIYLKNNGLYYVDIKMSNLLFKFIEDKNIIVSLGDFGSTSVFNNGCSALTYPPFEYKEYSGLIKITESNFNYIISWNIGCLLLFLFTKKEPLFLVFYNIYNTETYWNELITKIKNLNNNEQTIIKKYLANKPNERPDINKSIELIYNEIILNNYE